MQSAMPAPGTRVWIRQTRWRVDQVRREGALTRLDVSNRDKRCTFLAPFDRPFRIVKTDRRARVSVQQARARLAGLLARSGHDRRLASVLDARIEILPYQLEPALAVIGGARRVLIADEVGLGKTVQAGLIAAELQQRQPALRALLLVPTSLRAQWTDELRSRLGLACQSADAGAIARVARSAGRGDNPWLGPGVWIASLDYLKQPHVLEALPRRAWDLLIVDEAHGACGDSARHTAADVIARRSRVVVLLTATPHSGDDASFKRLVDLGRLSGVPDDLVIFRRTRCDIALEVPRRTHWHALALTPEESRLFDALTIFERTVLAAAGDVHRGAALLLLSVFRKRALSTTAALVASLDRRLAWLDSSEPPEPEWHQPALVFDGDDESPSLAIDVGLDMRRERSWLARLRALAGAASVRESKVQCLAAIVRRTREPIVVFTEFRDSLALLARRLEPIRPVAMIHGGLTPEEQNREIASFLSGRTSLLLATDVAGQGLNLQARARSVINLELPWNPARLEQRAGRVDRIGQTRRVHVILLVARHDAESGVLLRLARRALSAQRALGSDVLESTIPNDQQLRAHLLAGDALSEPAASQSDVPLCRRWFRPARSAARDLARRRLLIRHWRCGSEEPGRAGVTMLPRWPRLQARVKNQSLLIFTVSINDGSGRAIERHVVALHAASDREGDVQAIVETARSAAAALQNARARRLQSRLRGQTGLLRERERALAALLETTDFDDGQRGLFDRRTERLAAVRARERIDVQLDLEARLRDLEDRASVEIGRPALELIFLSGR